MNGLRTQVPRFALVGIAATGAHVVGALAAAHGLGVREELANVLGFCCGVVVSYLGHSYYTFGVNAEHGFQVPRFVVLSLTGLMTSTLITWIVCTVFGGPLILAMALMVMTVPAITFLGMKLWVFTAGHRQPPGS